MELLGDVGHVESHFFLFRDSVTAVQDRCMVSPTVPSAQKSFWTHPMILLGHEAQVKALSVWG
jgi:hypothetical protein